MKATRADAERLMFKGALAMSQLSQNGICIDMQQLDRQISMAEEEIAEIQGRLKKDDVWLVWRKTFGDQAVMGSKAQLAKVIFDKLGYQRPRATSKKHRSDEYDADKRESKHDEATFQDVDLPFIKDFFRCEKLKKMLGTYFLGLKREACDGKIHPFFDLHKVISYRSSSSMPNFHNVPKRNKEVSARIRQCFIPRRGRRFVEVDFKGVEVAVSACYCGDRNLIRYVSDSSTDMHRDLAARLFGFDVDFLLKNKPWAKATVRDWAKNRMTFPQFYGSVYFQCAPSLWKAVISGAKLPDGKTTIQEHLAKQGIRELGDIEPGARIKAGTWVHRVKQAEDYLWNEMFPEFTAWKKRWHRKYLKRGYFDSLTGFRYTGLFKKNDVLNYATQGSAFHCNLQVIIWLLEEIRQREMRTMLIGQVHDSDLADTPDRELQDYLNLIHGLTTKRLPQTWDWINVPMEIEVDVGEIGDSWRNLKEWVMRDGIWQPA